MALPGSAGPAKIAPSECPIEHVIVLMMENRSFDHMLGRLPGVDGLQRDMFNTREDGEPVYVHRQRDFLCTLGDLGHSRQSSLGQFNDGANDGFVRDSGSQSMGYMSEQELPFMYALAREYTVFDRWFCGILGPTWPNREYLMAGTSAGRTSNEFSPKTLGLHEKTVFHQILEAGGDFGIYFTDIPSAALYFDLVLRYGNKFKPFNQFYIDALEDRLPQVVLLEPGYFVGTDDHPPANVQMGQRLIADVIAALTASPAWEKCALLITYDEHGGFFDHVPPPNVVDDFIDRAGFRVPAILVSPWARRGVVSHEIHDHTSFLSFVQWRFGMAPLTSRNAAASDFVYAFDFSRMREDIPVLPTPPLDAHLTALCMAGRFMIGEASDMDMPGGEGPEVPTLWADSDISPAARVAQSLEMAEPAPPIRTEAIPPTGQPEMAEAADHGIIPAEMDLRPTPARATPNPYLDRSELPSRPAWKPRVLTASQLPRGRPLRLFGL